MRKNLLCALLCGCFTLSLAGCGGGDKVTLGTNKITASEAGDNKSPYQSYDQPKIGKKDGGGGGSGSGGGPGSGYGKGGGPPSGKGPGGKGN